MCYNQIYKVVNKLLIKWIVGENFICNFIFGSNGIVIGLHISLSNAMVFENGGKAKKVKHMENAKPIIKCFKILTFSSYSNI